MASLVETTVHPGVSENFLLLATYAHLLKSGGYFTLNTAFSAEMNSNTAVLTYIFDAGKFEYANFIPADGINVINVEASSRQVKVTIMKLAYYINNFGDVMLRATEDADISNGYETIHLTAEYVVKDGNRKGGQNRRCIRYVHDVCSAGKFHTYRPLRHNRLVWL